MKHQSAPHWISGAALQACVEPAALRAALRSTFAGHGTVAPLRHVHSLPSATPNTRLLLMPAWEAQTYFGVKVVSVFPGNVSNEHPTVNAIYALFSGENGATLALVDGEMLTLLRTGASSALAASFLARQDARHLLIVGAGRLAPWMARAHIAAHTYASVTFWSRDAFKSEQAAAALCADGMTAHIASNLQRACEAADVICCATTARSPVIQGAWITPGTHIDLVGGFTHEMREVDDALITKAAIFADSRIAVLSEAGDLTQPIAAGILSPDDVRAELGELCRGEHPGRTDEQQITLFKSVGSAVADLATAALAWKQTRHDQQSTLA